MHASEFSVMRACEDTHWWYVGLHEITLDFINQLAVPGDNSQFLDAGCGTGGFIEKCSNSHPEIVGMEPSEFAFNELKSRETELLARADLLRSPFPDNSFETEEVKCKHGTCSKEQDVTEEQAELLPAIPRMMKPPRADKRIEMDWFEPTDTNVVTLHDSNPFRI